MTDNDKMQSQPSDAQARASASARFGRQLIIFLELFRKIGPINSPHVPSEVRAALQDKRFGGRDRRLYKALIYSAMRLWPWLEGAKKTAAWAEVVAALSDLPPAQKALIAQAPQDLSLWPGWVSERLRTPGLTWRGLLPDWFIAQSPRPIEEDGAAAWALVARKPLWIRRQRVGWEVLGEALDQSQVTWRRPDPTVADAPDAASIEGDPDLTRLTPWREGWFEVQDLGAQRLLGIVPVTPGGVWLDACAGAGGKALQLAHLLGPDGSVYAEDVRADALSTLRERAARGGVSEQVSARVVSAAITSAEAGSRRFDGVLVDAPCTGTGTWGRYPHMRAVTTAADAQKAAALQLHLLLTHAKRLKPGGVLVYATCSLAEVENAAVVQAFLKRAPGFEVIPLVGSSSDVPSAHGLTLWPNQHDGFFVCALRSAA
jgi:16S rRNA (cytosine967-C5)-methyltransferase